MLCWPLPSSSRLPPPSGQLSAFHSSLAFLFARADFFARGCLLPLAGGLQFNVARGGQGAAGRDIDASMDESSRARNLHL